MTQEDKKLLLVDLCARLPYGVKVSFQVGNNTPDVRIFTGEDYDYLKGYHYIDEFTKCTFKPYLRPLSSMTKEERKEFGKFGSLEYSPQFEIEEIVDTVNWLNAHHFDYRGLIEKGLAAEAPKGMYE